jgi:hypothetical protein
MPKVKYVGLKDREDAFSDKTGVVWTPGLSADITDSRLAHAMVTHHPDVWAWDRGQEARSIAPPPTLPPSAAPTPAPTVAPTTAPVSLIDPASISLAPGAKVSAGTPLAAPVPTEPPATPAPTTAPAAPKRAAKAAKAAKKFAAKKASAKKAGAKTARKAKLKGDTK